MSHTYTASHNFPFHDRTSYLNWLCEWKHDMKRIVEEIRAQRAIMRDPASQGTYRHAVACRERMSLRHQATAMLDLRLAAKMRSREMRAGPRIAHQEAA